MPHINANLWSHQTQMREFALDRLNKLGYAWWIAGCAVGKTLAAYATLADTGSSRALVLTRKPAIQQAWVTNASLFTQGFNTVPLIDGTSKDYIKLLDEHRATPNLVAVVNYETALKLVDTIRDYGFDTVVADESHKLKSHNSQISERLAIAVQRIPHRLAMTGTAFDDRPTDVYGQVRYLAGASKHARGVRSTLLGTWTDFFERYVVYRQIDNIKIPIRYKNQDELRERISPFTLYLNTEDVLDLPAEQDITWTCEWPAPLLRVYREMEQDLIAEYRDKELVADNVLVQGLRLQQLTGGYFDHKPEGEYIATPKVGAVLDILDQIGKAPTVIFTAFETDIHALREPLIQNGYSVKYLVGGTYEHEEFQRGEGDVILVNLAAGNAGIELTRARYAIYYSVGNSLTNYNQSRYRIRRPGSDLTMPITYYHIVMPNSIDTDMLKAMQSKEKVSEFLLNGMLNRVLRT